MVDEGEARVVLITGAASGIGAATSMAFAEAGYRVLLADVDVEAGQRLAATLDGDFARCDVGSEVEVAAAVALALEKFGRLDVHINNAAILGPTSDIADIEVADWDRVMAVDLRGAFLGIKHAARAMKPRGRGSILSVASVTGPMGGLGPHAYSCARHGLIGLTRSAASELIRSGIRVNAVAPGPVVTPMVSNLIGQDLDTARTQLAAGSPTGAAIEGADIAAALLFLASDAARHVNGHVLTIDGGMTTAPARQAAQRR